MSSAINVEQSMEHVIARKVITVTMMTILMKSIDSMISF